MLLLLVTVNDLTVLPTAIGAALFAPTLIAEIKPVMPFVPGSPLSPFAPLDPFLPFLPRGPSLPGLPLLPRLGLPVAVAFLERRPFFIMSGAFAGAGAGGRCMLLSEFED